MNNNNNNKLIVEWADTRKTEVKEFRTVDELIEFASIAKFLGAKVCCQICGEWVWS